MTKTDSEIISILIESYYENGNGINADVLFNKYIKKDKKNINKNKSLFTFKANFYKNKSLLKTYKTLYLFFKLGGNDTDLNSLYSFYKTQLVKKFINPIFWCYYIFYILIILLNRFIFGFDSIFYLVFIIIGLIIIIISLFFKNITLKFIFRLIE